MAHRNVTGVLIVSPHLDDAVFSCGQILAANPGSLVVTALAGLPAADAVLTPWDAHTGYASSRDGVLARREEDRCACELLDAKPLWLDGLDAQYERPTDHDRRLAGELEAVLQDNPDASVLLPLGIHHDDHLLVSRLARAVTRSLGRSFLIYEELPYRVDNPYAHDAARRRVWDEGWDLKPASQMLGPIETKKAAVELYASQINQFKRESLFAAESVFVAKPRGDRARSLRHRMRSYFASHTRKSPGT